MADGHWADSFPVCKKMGKGIAATLFRQCHYDVDKYDQQRNIVCFMVNCT